eukprot:gene17988-8538_t
MLFAVAITAFLSSAAPPVWLDTSVARHVRVAALVAAMNTSEKLQQLVTKTPAIPHLLVPAYHWRNNILHGTVDNGVSTQFPQSIGMAASFDTVALNAAARVMSDEQVSDGRVQEDLAKPEVDAATGKAALLMPRIYFLKSKQSIQSFPDLQSLVQHCQQHPITPKHGCSLKLGRAARPLLLENAATSASASDALYSCTYGEVDSNLLDFYKKVVVGNHEIYDSSDTSNPLAPIKGTPSVSLKEAIKRAEAHCGVLPDDCVTEAEKCAAMHAKKAKGKKHDQKRQDERNLEAIDIQSIFLYTIPCELYKKMNAALGKYGDEPDPRGNVVHYMPYI